MLNFAEVNEKVVELLRLDSELLADGVKVIRGEYINNLPERCPWIGVYRTDATYTPRSMGRHDGSWEVDLVMRLVLQASSLKSGGQAEDRLEDLIQKTVSALWASPTLKGAAQTGGRSKYKVEHIVGFKVEYSYKETDSKTLYFQEAMLTINAKARAGT